MIFTVNHTHGSSNNLMKIVEAKESYDGLCPSVSKRSLNRASRSEAPTLPGSLAAVM